MSLFVLFTKHPPPHLVVVELAVLQVGRGGDGAHAGVGVVVRVLAHAVWETLLEGGRGGE